MVFSFLTLGIYGVLFASVLALPVQHGLATRADISPIMSGQNFPDPGVIKTAKGWYAFKTWQFTPGDDAFPSLPSWVDSGNARVVSIPLSIGPYNEY
jgi:hypothetical protein